MSIPLDTERGCLDMARMHEESIPLHEAKGHTREVADCRHWAAWWRREAARRAAQHAPDPSQPEQLDMLAYLEEMTS